MGFRPKWQPRLRHLLPLTTKSDRRTSPPACRRRRAHRRSSWGTSDVRPWFSLATRGLTPCPNQTTTYPNPNRRPLGRQLCLPISPTSRKTRAPSCSRLLTLPRPTRLRARRLLRPNANSRETRGDGKTDVGHLVKPRRAHSAQQGQGRNYPARLFLPCVLLIVTQQSRYDSQAHLAAVGRLRLRTLASATTSGFVSARLLRPPFGARGALRILAGPSSLGPPKPSGAR
jgi:hypothetical protein